MKLDLIGANEKGASRSQLSSLLSMLGFTVFDSILDGFLEEAGAHGVAWLTFDMAVKVVMTCQRSAGFGKSEVEELSRVFRRFDEDDSGQIESHEIVDLLRFLGHSTCLAEVRKFVEQADSNKNGALDLHEFLHVMRIHREVDIKATRQVFDTHCVVSPTQKLLPVDDLGTALREMVQEPRPDLVTELATSADAPEAFTFEAFVAAADRCRKLDAGEKRRRAGFSLKEFEDVQSIFKKHVKPGSKELEKGELLFLLMEMSIDVCTQAERLNVFRQVEKGRKLALEAGVEEEDAGGTTGIPTTVWVLTHFLQVHRGETVGADMGEEENMIDRSKFTRAEVAEFRSLFNHWVASAVDKERPAQIMSQTQQIEPRSRRASLPNLAGPITTSISSPELGADSDERVPAASVFGGEKELPRKSMLLLVESIGLQLSPKQRIDLDCKIIAEGTSGPDGIALNFGQFLMVMRWMLDTNFADINGAAQKAVDCARQQSDLLPRTPSKQGVANGLELPETPPARSRADRRRSV